MNTDGRVLMIEYIPWCPVTWTRPNIVLRFVRNYQLCKPETLYRSDIPLIGVPATTGDVEQTRNWVSKRFVPYLSKFNLYLFE